MYCKNATAAISSAVINQFGNLIAYTPNKRQAKPNKKKQTRNQNNTCSSALITLLPAGVHLFDIFASSIGDGHHGRTEQPPHDKGKQIEHQATPLACMALSRSRVIMYISRN